MSWQCSSIEASAASKAGVVWRGATVLHGVMCCHRAGTAATRAGSGSAHPGLEAGNQESCSMADKLERVVDLPPAPPEGEGNKPFPTPAKNTEVKSEPPADPAPRPRHPEPTD